MAGSAGPLGGEQAPPAVVRIDVGALSQPDLASVDALARLQLHARRSGRSLRLVDAGPELRALLALLGLDDALPTDDALPLDAGSGGQRLRQAEEGEEPRRVEEVRHPGDPTP